MSCVSEDCGRAKIGVRSKKEKKGERNGPKFSLANCPNLTIKKEILAKLTTVILLIIQAFQNGY